MAVQAGVQALRAVLLKHVGNVGSKQRQGGRLRQGLWVIDKSQATTQTTGVSINQSCKHQDHHVINWHTRRHLKDTHDLCTEDAPLHLRQSSMEGKEHTYRRVHARAVV